MRVFKLVLCLVALYAGAMAHAFTFEELRRDYEQRAVKVHATATGACVQAFRETCDQSGSAVVMVGAGELVLLATAAHVLSPLFADAADGLGRLDLDWPFPPKGCRANLSPVAIWKPSEASKTRDDAAFIVASSDCKEPLDPPANAWANGEPSLGVTLNYIELYSLFGPQKVSAPFFLSNGCIRANTCFDDGLVRVQARIEGKSSGSGVFSDDGLVGIAVETGVLVSARSVFGTFAGCSAGGCERLGPAFDLSGFASSIEQAGAPAKPYSEQGLQQDIAAVQTYLQTVPPHVWRQTESFCHTDVTRTSFALEHTGERLTLTRTARKRRDACNSLPSLIGLEVLKCSAPSEALNPAIQIGSGPSLFVACYASDCWLCDFRYTAEIKGHDGVDDQRSYALDEFDIQFSRAQLRGTWDSPDPTELDRFYDVTRALSRMISGGSHDAFCQSTPEYCTPQE